MPLNNLGLKVLEVQMIREQVMFTILSKKTHIPPLGAKDFLVRHRKRLQYSEKTHRLTKKIADASLAYKV